MDLYKYKFYKHLEQKNPLDYKNLFQSILTLSVPNVHDNIYTSF